MTALADYQYAFRNLAIDRTDGVIEVRMHSDGGSLRWGIDPDSVHEEGIAWMVRQTTLRESNTRTAV